MTNVAQNHSFTCMTGFPTPVQIHAQYNTTHSHSFLVTNKHAEANKPAKAELLTGDAESNNMPILHTMPSVFLPTVQHIKNKRSLHTTSSGEGSMNTKKEQKFGSAMGYLSNFSPVSTICKFSEVYHTTIFLLQIILAQCCYSHDRWFLSAHKVCFLL